MSMFSSWPVSALVVGVNSGSGNSWDSCSPAGIGNVPAVPCLLYSDHADPVIYPLTMHSMSILSAFFTTIALSDTSTGKSIF